MTRLEEFKARYEQFRGTPTSDLRVGGENYRLFANVENDHGNLLAALDAVLALHQPITVYEYDLDKGELNEEKVMAELCRECTGDSVLEAIGDCHYDPIDYHDETPYPCPTVAAVSDALGGEA